MSPGAAEGRSGCTGWRPARCATLPHAYTQGVPSRGVFDTLSRLTRGDLRRVAQAPEGDGVTILLIYKRLWPDPG